MEAKVQAIKNSEWNSLKIKPLITVGKHRSPWGRCIISQAGDALCGLSFGDFAQSEILDTARLDWPGAEVCYDEGATGHWVSVASDYLKGKSLGEEHSILLLGTPFQLAVWGVLWKMKVGEIASYQDIANRVGHPSAVRAVGSAVGKNKISLLIPCHRVIRSSGRLGGYAWGIGLKQTLLDYEAQFCR